MEKKFYVAPAMLEADFMGEVMLDIESVGTIEGPSVDGPTDGEGLAGKRGGESSYGNLW